MLSNDWITHNGQGAPDLPPGTRVQVKMRDPLWVDVAPHWTFEEWEDNWDHTYPCSADIIAYRVVPDER